MVRLMFIIAWLIKRQLVHSNIYQLNMNLYNNNCDLAQSAHWFRNSGSHWANIKHSVRLNAKKKIGLSTK